MTDWNRSRDKYRKGYDKIKWQKQTSKVSAVDLNPFQKAVQLCIDKGAKIGYV